MFVANPWTDYAKNYDEGYYRGEGADPWIDYVYELEHPEATVRQYEWRGIQRLVDHLCPLTAETQWLDFGCGNGGLVRYVRAHSSCGIVGYDEGWAAGMARDVEIPVLADLEALSHQEGKYDVITAIEVLEHVEKPLEVLGLLFRLLKPGGLLFLTTGNAEPNRTNFLNWRYVIPAIHISYVEPGTIVEAMQRVGFRPERRGFLPGFADIIRYKVLKNLRQRKVGVWERLLPWGLWGRIVDRFHKVTDHPLGYKPT